MVKQFLLNEDGSVPSNVNREALEREGVVFVRPTKPPVKSGMMPKESQPELLPDGIFSQTWELVPIEEIKLPEAQVADKVRQERDLLLLKTDWIVIKSYERGENIPAEWELYRQALRDITAQADFPYSVEWPTKP